MRAQRTWFAVRGARAHGTPGEGGINSGVRRVQVNGRLGASFGISSR